MVGGGGRVTTFHNSFADHRQVGSSCNSDCKIRLSSVLCHSSLLPPKPFIVWYLWVCLLLQTFLSWSVAMNESAKIIISKISSKNTEPCFLVSFFVFQCFPLLKLILPSFLSYFSSVSFFCLVISPSSSLILTYYNNKKTTVCHTLHRGAVHDQDIPQSPGRAFPSSIFRWTFCGFSYLLPSLFFQY